MKRDIDTLASRQHDVLVIGGGIHGAAILREAALIGLSAALVEQHDFASSTSSNSLKIIHGGLRYLQQADVPRLLESVRERRFFLSRAPHLVAPLPCIMPTRGLGLYSAPALGAAFLINDILSCNRNANVPPSRRIPPGRLVPKRRALEILPGISSAGVTGGAIWHDALAYDTERLVVGVVRSATEASATACNYVKALRPLAKNGRITGIVARDMISCREFEIAARLVINTAPITLAGFLGSSPVRIAPPSCGWALMMNLVLRRQVISGYAAGLYSRRGRLLFFVPWRNRTIVGTSCSWVEGNPEDVRVTDAAVDELLADVREAYPGADIAREDIAMIHAGLVPASKPRRPGAEPAVARHFRLLDHSRLDGIEGLISVIGVKLTTARNVAEHVMRLAAAKLGKTLPRLDSSSKALPGGDTGDPEVFFAAAKTRMPPSMPAAAVEHLLRCYGTEWDSVIKTSDSDPSLLNPLSGQSEIIGAQAIFAVREEMAMTLSDVVFRRTGLGTTGLDDRQAVTACAAAIGKELKWSEERMREEAARLSADPFNR